MSTQTEPNELVAQRPRFTAGWPHWFHHHGNKMKIERCLMIASSAVRLTITAQAHWYDITWKIAQASGHPVYQTVIMDQHTLEAAFGIRDFIAENATTLISDFGGSSAIR